MALSATKTWSQKSFNEDLASMGGTDYFSVVGPIDELSDDKRCIRAPGIPKLGQSHPTHRLLKVTSLDAGPGLAERLVTVRYQWNPPAAGAASGGANSREVRITWSRASRNLSLDRDVYGNLLTNSAGDVFDPLPQTDLISYQCEIVRWESFFNITKAYEYTGKVNSADMVAGGVRFRKGTVMMSSIAPAESYTPSQNPIPIAYTLEIRTPLAGAANDIVANPFFYWAADIGTKSMWKMGNNDYSKGDLYWKTTNANNSSILGDAVTVPEPLSGGAPIKSDLFVVTSLAQPPVAKSQLKKQVKVVELGGIFWLGYEIYKTANLLELGL